MPLQDLLGNLIILLVFAALGFWLSSNRQRARIGIGLSIVVGGLGALMVFRPDLFTPVFPMADLLYYSNWFPFAAALFIPCVIILGKTRAQRIRMGVLCAVLLGVSLKEYHYHYLPLARSNEARIDADGVCRQSSGDTCSAASIVTLLRRYNVDSNEQEAIELARTKERIGTRHLGLYRALKIKTRGRKDATVTLKKIAPDALLNRNRPAIITVGLPKKPSPEALAFGEKYNWQPGFLHDVVFLGRDEKRPGHVLIGEPDFGLESWSVDHLRFLFYGFAVMVD